MVNKNLTTWKAVAQETALIEDGDILLPLKRLRDQYTRKAEKIEERMPGKGASDDADKAKRKDMLLAAGRYHYAAWTVQKLIGTVATTDFIEIPAPVDKMEEILSDEGPGTQAPEHRQQSSWTPTLEVPSEQQG